MTENHTSYEVNMTLMNIDPAIWRQVRVPGSITLQQLHMVTQIAMGWQNSHLHLFEVEGNTYASFDGEIGVDYEDSTDLALHDLNVDGGKPILYVYDFGDGWRHEISIESLPRTATRFPRCIGGARACPPEDCGGVGGYYGLLEALGNAEHPEHDRMLMWTGGGYDPDHFDPRETNRKLRWYWHHRDQRPSRRSIRRLCDRFLKEMQEQVATGTVAQYSRDLDILCGALDRYGFYFGVLDDQLLYEKGLAFTDVADVEPMLAYLEDFFRHYLLREALVNDSAVKKCRGSLRRFVGWLGEEGILKQQQADSHRRLLRDAARDTLEEMQHCWLFFRWPDIDLQDARTWTMRLRAGFSAVRENSVDLWDDRGRRRWKGVRAPEELTRAVRQWSTYGVQLIYTRGGGFYLAGVLLPGG